jgi:hypothetical protein
MQNLSAPNYRIPAMLAKIFSRRDIQGFTSMIIAIYLRLLLRLNTQGEFSLLNNVHKA